MHGEAAAKETIMKLHHFCAPKSYQNINFDRTKNRDINLMIIYLIFYQNCNFLATHVDARSRNGDFLLSSVESSRCAGNWQTRVWKLKLKWNKLVDLRNLYPNMVVFGLELLIFWSWFRIWTWKYRFPTFLKIWFCSGGAGKARFNVATPTNATVTCTAYVLPYNFQTKFI